jgi:hypothetical protein
VLSHLISLVSFISLLIHGYKEFKKDETKTSKPMYLKNKNFEILMLTTGK